MHKFPISHHPLLQNLGVNMTHIESRPSLSHPGEQYDFYIDCECNRETLIQLVEDLKKFALAVTIKTMTPEGDDDGMLY